MKNHSILLFMLLLLLMATADSQCPVLCDSCPVGTSSCSYCYASFEDTSLQSWTASGTCPCPDGYFMNSTTKLCLFCPVTCETCTDLNTCTSCVPGYEINQLKQCAKRYSNPGQWLTMDVALDLSQQKLSKYNYEGFYLTDYVPSLNVTNMIRSCESLNSQLFFGMYSFDYNTQVVKSYFGLAHHDWVQVKFQFVAINRWTATNMILEINDRESYKLSDLEGVYYTESKQYSSGQRHRNFCFGTSTNGDADNLGFISVYLPHQQSMLKLRIRTDLTNLTSIPSGTDYPSLVYFGLSNLFIRTGTCPTNCKKCAGPNVCIQCISPYVTTGTGTCECNLNIAQLTETGRCVKKCQPGYIFTKLGTIPESRCILCSLLEDRMRNCFACASVNNAYQCTTCMEGFVLNSTGYCVESCPPSTYIQVNYDSTLSINKITCVACATNCLTCSFGICTQCANNTFYQQGSCVQSCALAFYLDLSRNTCVRCPINCKNCTSKTVCTQCESTLNFTLSSGLCIPQCNSSSTNCSTNLCHSSCSSCFGTTQTSCLSCSSPSNFLQNYKCVPSCSASYFSFDSSQCLPCNYPCSSCTNFQACTSCQPSHVLYQQTCILQCPLNFYSDSLRVCKLCPSNCKTCFNETVCLTCINNYIMFEGTCVIATPCSQRDGFYFDEKTLQCLPCSQNCSSCYKDLCFRCKTASVLDNGKCVSQCSEEKTVYQQIVFDNATQTNLTSRVCKWKDILCSTYTMVNGSSVCNQCIFMNPMLVLLSNNKCSFTCLLGQVKVEANNVVTCQACPANCIQCLSNLTCVKCDTSYVLNPVRTTGSIQCLSSCPQGFTSDGYQCLACKTNCKTCDITGRCLECMTSFALTSANSCVNNNCNLNQYLSGASTCLNCPSNCLTCNSLTSCSSCGVSSGVQLYLQQTMCQEKCNDGFWPDQLGFQCKKCPSECLKCVSATQCTVCLISYYLLMHPIQRISGTNIGTCVKECPIGYYNSNPLLTTDKQIAVCAFCSSNCLTCYGPTEDQCLSCYGRFKLVNSRCVQLCPFNKYQDSTGHCDWCHPSCMQCTGPAQFQCKTCSQGYYLYRSTCYSYSCPGSTYPVDYDSRVCELCQWGCQVCTNPYNCSVCTGGFYLYDGWCYSQCPANTQPYLDLVNQGYRCGTCSIKWSNCLQCLNSTCQRCTSGYLLSSTNSTAPCVATCPYGFYPQFSPIAQCKRCPANCFTCISQQTCTSCQQYFILSNGQCSTKCPKSKFYSYYSNSCTSCSSNCQDCNSTIQCQNCMENYYLYTEYQSGSIISYCVSDCGDQRYEDQDSKTCQNCSMNCRYCNDLNNCTRCSSGFTLLNGYCYQAKTTPTCNVSRCAECLNAQVCQTCQIPLFLWIAVSSSGPVSFCAEKCPVGMWTAGRTCHRCNTTCVKCKNGANDCEQCIPGWFLHHRRCYKECPRGNYENSTTGNCTRCPQNCFDCTNATYCKTCKSGKKAYKGQCYDSCLYNTYEQGSNCFECPSTCKKCRSLNYCSQCKTGYVLFQGQCKLQCPSTHYLTLDESGPKCTKCRYPCSTCKGESQCNTCRDDYSFDGEQNKCVDNCRDGMYAKNASINGYLCTPCPKKCKSCLNSTFCLKCEDQYTLFKGNCLQECPIGVYRDNSTQSCRSCSPNCLACRAYDACIQCHNQTVLFKGKCVDLCPSGTFKATQYSYELRTSTNLCKPCQSPCKDCNGSSIFNCQSCIPTMYLYQNVCVGSCPAGYYQTTMQLFSSTTVTMNLVKNGDFSRTKCVGDWCLYPASGYNNEVDGWIPDDEIEIGYGRIYSSYLGAERVLELAPNKNTCVKQLIPNLTAGDYLLQFTWSARAGRSFNDCQFKAYFNGQQVKSVTPSDYLTHTESLNLTLSTSSSSTELKFCSVGGDNNSYGAVLKDIVLAKKTTEMTSFDTNLINTVQMKCVKCPAGCLTCTSKDVCTTCVTGWTLNSIGQCRPNTNCTLPNCEICEVVSSTNVCWKCINPYSLIRNTLIPAGFATIAASTSFACVLNCPINTFKTIDFTCLPCPANCTACTYTDCSACKAGLYLFDKTCVQSCPIGFTSNSTSNSCTPTPCLYRNSANLCQKCISPYLLYKGQCIATCPSQTYQQDSYCVECDQKENHCFNCTSLTSCTSCINGYFLYLGVCVSKCPLGYYLNTSSTGQKNCIFCQTFMTGCLSCISSTICTECKFPYFLTSLGQCQLNCPIGTFRSPYSQQCIQCSLVISDSCLACSNETTCTNCNNRTVLFNGKCISQCPSGFYLSSLTCQPCNSKCFTCSSSTNCTLCKQGFFLLSTNASNVITLSCVEVCPSGYFETLNSTCQLCRSECLTCNMQSCLSCPPGKFLFEGKCLSTCPDHYYGLNGNCLVCNSQCKTCFSSASSCLTCYSGYIYQSNTKTCLKNCTSVTQYYDPLTYSCQNCSTDCETCYGPRYDQCLTCKDPLSLVDGLCSLTCPSGYYRDSNSVCKICDSTKCLTCLGSDSNCTDCLYPKVLVIYNNGQNGRCDVNCGSGFYYDQLQLTCKACSTGCVSCIDAQTCIACQNTKFLYLSQCITTCPAGFTAISTLSSTTCQKCPTNCAQCTYSTTTSTISCTQCISPLYLYNNTCYTTCPTSTYLLTTACQSCPQRCQTCTSATNCISCKFPYVFNPSNSQCLDSCPSGYQNINSVCKEIKTCSQMIYNGICYPQCPLGTFATNGSNQCMDCPITCAQCLAGEFCTVCKVGFYMYVNENELVSCVATCPAKTYLNNKYCTTCPAPCQTCIPNSDNTVSCLTCLTGYSLDGKCLATCPNGYYPLNGACTKCMSKCLTCDANGCLTCANSQYTAPTCESSTVVCTTGQYVSQLTNACANCDQSCLSCFGPSAGQCKACKNVSSTVYYLFGSSCLTDCPEGYVKDSTLNKCTACSITNCKNCSTSSSSCVTCNSGYILFTNSSTTKCILSCSDLTTSIKTYISSSTNSSTCISCDSQIPNCFDCFYSSTSLKTICTTCASGYYYLQSGNCTNTCSNGWYISQGKYCLPCGSNCNVCTSDTVCQTCVTGYSLYLGSCLSACPIGFYSGNGICTQCSSNCRTCTSTTCTQCITPYTQDTSGQCTLCIAGYFMSSSTSQCQICSTNCLECQTSQTTCTRCAEPMFLFNSQCLSLCPTGYYGNTLPAIDTCSTCDSVVTNCATCVSTTCLKCKDFFYLQPIPASNTYSCVYTCALGYYPNTANMICLKCNLANCLECSTLTQCITCVSGFYALQGSCYSTCPQGYAPSTTNGQLSCVPCKTGCKSCPANVNTCVLCDTNLQIDSNGNCVPVPNNCLSTQYLNTLGTCSLCHETCLTCFGGLRINCLTCRTPGYQLQTDNSCKEMCLSSQYYDTSLSQCKPCTDKYGPYCTYCDSQSCSSCSQGVLSSDSQSCITSCTGATYQYNGVCTNCPQYCKTCNSSTYCSECISLNYFLYNNLCYDTCPIMTQAFNGTCRPCDDKCLACIGTTTNCTSCKSIYKLVNNSTCVDACPTGTFETTAAGVNGAVCQPCMSPCFTCLGTAINCTSCIPGYSALFQNQCVYQCPSQTYLNSADKTCQTCQYPCATCISSPANCTSCATGFNYLVSTNTCSNQCAPGTYISTNPSTSVTSCVPCAVSYCRTCDATQCYKCQPNYFGTLSATNATISCTTTCPDYFYPDLVSQTCIKCKDLCITCNSTINCQKCVTPYFLYQDQCLTSCPDQTYQILNAGGFKCQNCGNLCSVCIDNVTCTICQDDSYLLNGICYSSCPARYYERTSDKTCQPCSIDNCGKCSITQCQRCADGFYGVTDGSGQILSCVTDCGNFFFENQLTAMCEKCLDSCKTCTNSTTCLQCITPKSLFINGTQYMCLSQCPEYYFSDTSTTPLQCRRCESKCLQCFTPEKCYNCEQNYTLFYNSSTQDTCINQCPIAYYQTSTPEGYAYCEACSSHCLKCLSSHECTTCEDTHTLVNAMCIPHNCVNCDSCDETVSPAICKNCTQPYYLYKVKCLDNCPIYYFNAINESTLVRECQKCIENCVNCTTKDTCDACIPDYIFVKGDGCVNEAVHNYGQAANMSGFTSNITQTMAKIYMGTSVGPVAFGEMTTTYFNLQFTQFMLFHPTGGNPEMTEFLNSLQTMSLTNGGTTVSNSTAPAEVQARRRLLTAKSTYFTESFIQVNASIFYLMFAFIGAYATIWIFQKFVTEALRVSCNTVWFYIDAVCEFMQKRFKWIYFDFIMWLSYIPFLYFSVMQLKEFNFQTGSQGFSSILAIVIIATYPLYPIFICYLMRSHYSEISTEPGEEEIKQTLTEMSLSPFLTKVKRPIKNIVIPFEEQEFSFGKYFNKINFILIYYPLKYVRKFAFVLVAALVQNPVHMVSTLIAINVTFIIYMIVLRPRVMPYIVFDLVIEFILLAFEVFLLIYLFMDGPKVAMMSIVTHAVGFITANLSLITAIILNLIAYYKIFLCIKDLISHLRERAVERQEAYNKFEVQKKFLDPNSDLYIEKEIGKLKKLNDDDDTDEDDSDLRLSGNARKLLENLGQKDLLLNGIDPIKYIKDLTKKENFGIEEKQIALKYVNEDDVTDSDGDSLDENAMQIAKKLQMNEKNLALNKIHPVKFAKELTKDDAPLEKQYKKFDEKHIDSKLVKKINDDGLTDSDDDSIDDNVMNIARNLNLNEKQLALNDINPVKFLKEDTKKDAPLEDRYKKFDEKNVDKRIARVINEDNATDSDDSEIDQEVHDLAKKLQLNEKQLAFNEINPVKFFKEETKKDAPLQEQYHKFDEKHMDKHLAKRINEENNTDSESDSSVDEDAHKLARKLNLNEKQLAFNQINPLKFFKEQTKKDAPLEQQYENFDEKNVDRKLQRIINDDGDTDSEDQETTEENEGYRIARQLKLNEKQLAANNLNPLKVMQEQAKQQVKLKKIIQQFDEKDIDMKVARIINDNGETSSEESDSDDEEVDKIIVARQLKLDEKELAANNINPVKYVKQATKVDPITNEPKINQAMLSFALEALVGAEKPRKKLLDKELRLRNEMKREVSENEHTDSDQEDNKLSKFTKEKLKNMSEKDMMMQGLDPIQAVKKITKEAIAKKMAKKLNSNHRVYDDEMPDFKVSNKPTSNPIKDVIRSTQEKLKESTKRMLGSKKQKGSQLPSEENLHQKGANMKLIDSESDQETQNLTSKPAKMIKSTNVKIGENKLKNVGRREVQNDWDDQFEAIDKKKAYNSNKPKNIIFEEPQKQRISLVDPNNKIKNFHQEFSEQFISQQSSEAALNNKIKHSYEQDLESINLQHHKSNKLIKDSENSRKIINLDQDKSIRPQGMKKDGESKQSRSQLNMKTEKHVRQDEMFNEFQEFEDLGQIQTKEINDKKNQRKNIEPKSNDHERIHQEPKKRVTEQELFEDDEISSVEQKEIKEAKFKRNYNVNGGKNGEYTKQATQEGKQPSSRSQIKSDKNIDTQKYSELVKKNKANMKVPEGFKNQTFEDVEYQARPSRGISRNKSKLNSDNESESGDYSNIVRKQRNEGRQRTRSRQGRESEINNIQSKRSSQVVRNEKQGKLRVQKLKIENMSENEDEIERVDV